MNILLTKAHDISAFCSKDDSRYVLQGAHYNAALGQLEASTGWLAIRLPVVKDENEFPVLPNGNGNGAPADCIIPAKALSKAVARIPKSHFPILEHAKLDTKGAFNGAGGEFCGNVTLTTTDTDKTEALTVKAIEGQFPNVAKVFPTEPAKAVMAVDPAKLAVIAEYFAKHCTGQRNSIRLEMVDELSPLRISGYVAEGRKAEVVLMPTRMS